MKTNSHSQFSVLSTAKYMIIAGAKPNEIASTSESSSSPKRLPGAGRARDATIERVGDAAEEDEERRRCAKSGAIARTIAKMPQNRLKSVNPFGSEHDGPADRRHAACAGGSLARQLRDHGDAGERRRRRPSRAASPSPAEEDVDA